MIFSVTHTQPWLVSRFPCAYRVISWSLTHPGFCTNNCVVWLSVRNADLPVEVDATAYLLHKMKTAGYKNAVGLMTSRDVSYHHQSYLENNGTTAQCLTTVGLSNAVHVNKAVKPLKTAYVGTINTLCATETPLSDGALIEAISIATEARTAALLDLQSPTNCDMPHFTGTGTDCMVICCPLPDSKTEVQVYAGLHTSVGQAIGQTVFDATRQAAAEWLSDYNSENL